MEAEVFEIICKLQAIVQFSKDIHYSVDGWSMYGNHLFADVVGDQEQRNEYIDLIKEVYYLGRGMETPSSKEIELRVSKILPEKSKNENENWLKLKTLIKECLVDIEMLKELTRGEENLFGAIAQDLQQMNGLLGLRVEDWVEDYDLNEVVENGRWITIGHKEEDENGEGGRKGRHIYLDDGETPKEAIEELKDKDKKLEKSEKEEKSNKEDKQEEKNSDKKKGSLIKKIDSDIDSKQNELSDIYKKIRQKKEEMLQEDDEYENLKFSERQRKRIEIENKAYDFYKEKLDKVKSEIENLKNKRNEEFNKIIDEKSESLKGSIENYSQKVKEVADKLYSLHGGEDNKKKIDELNKKINDLFSDFMKTKKPIESYAEMAKPYYDELAKLNRKTAENRLKHSEEISKIYRNLFNTEFKVNVSKSQISDFEKNVSSCLNGIISESYSDLPELTVNMVRGRAYFNPLVNSIYVSKQDNVFTQIHEYMHFIEDNNVDMLANSIAFLEYRTKGEKAYKMNKLTNSRAYGADEISKKDNFFNAYCGKIYDSSGDYRKVKATELMSMGVERLFKDPVNFYEEDKEYFTFVLWNLTGGKK